MKITFDNKAINSVEQNKIEHHRTGRERNASRSTKVNSDYSINWQNRTAQNSKKGKTIQDIQQEAEGLDVALMQNFMTVMSHTVSQEDYAKMEEEGFDFSNMDPKTAVNILDKIKAELAKSGEHIVGYTDDISQEVLAEAVGSEGLAKQIAQVFGQMDIPLTQENVEQTTQAVEMATSLKEPSEEEYQYMIDNEMEGTIRNFYMAHSSGVAQNVEAKNNQNIDYYQEGIDGYYYKSANGNPIDNLESQIDKIMHQEGIEITEDTKQVALWLVERNLPLTKENISRQMELLEIEFPITEEVAVTASAAAIAEGKSALEGNLSDTKSIYQKAVSWMETMFNQPLPDASQITARRQLEEIRLRMTVETNIKLIRSGFSIDTAPMEELIDALKQVEAQIAEDYFPKDAHAVEKYQQYVGAVNEIQEIPTYPAQIIGDWSNRIQTGTLETFCEEGKTLVESYKKAEEHYEALMTAPRSDMGDSIKKAFANVDDILTNLDLELSEENRKAIRILGYNSMELSINNIDAIKEAQKMVEHVVEKMTPAATLQMVRDGVNPLKQSFQELNDYFDSLPQEYGKEAEKYSQFLYDLEQNHKITEEEKTSFIGIYRLLRQVEKADSAAVGTLVNAQAEINFGNLLSAVRTNKTKHIDAKVSDALGTLTSLEQKGVSISEQINQGYAKTWEELNQAVSKDETAKIEYQQQQVESLRQAAISEQECMTLLHKADVTITANNLLAVQDLLQGQGGVFRKWKQTTEASNQENANSVDMENVWEALDEKGTFQEAYQTMLTDMSDAVEEVTFQENTSSIEVREMQLLHKQLFVMGQLAKQEEYNIPMYIGDELTNIHLVLEQGEEKGKVSISVDLVNLGHIEGRFQLQDGKISGYLSANTEEAVMKLGPVSDIFTNSVSEEWQVHSIQIVKGMPKSENIGGGTEATNEELYQVAKQFLTAMQNL